MYRYTVKMTFVHRKISAAGLPYQLAKYVGDLTNDFENTE
jgi:hypothetical protein